MYVNVYHVYRNYGGPEEGGWYYDSGEPLESHRCESREAANKLADELDAKIEHGDLGSVLGGEDVQVRVQDHPAKAFPEVRPHYE